MRRDARMFMSGRARRAGVVLLAGVVMACQVARPMGEPAPVAVRAPAVMSGSAQEVAERRRTEDERARNDWANLGRYREENAKLGAPATGEKRVVFYGNSITEGWARWFPVMFPGKPYVGRGIGGQTTPQMLVRFRQDVVSLKPAVVVILAGTNDIAGNTGPSSLEMIQDNLAGMSEIAKANGIRVVLCSVLPVHDYPWKPGLEPGPKIVRLNEWIRRYALSVGEVYVDYHSVMKDGRGGLSVDLAKDGVHPTDAGYRVMARVVEEGIREAGR